MRIIDLDEVIEAAKKLRQYPQAPRIDPTDVGFNDQNRNEAWAALQRSYQEKPDYSQIAETAKNYMESGNKQFLMGQIMAGRGGEQFSPLGRALALQGMEQAKPFRLNAADVALMDPTEGRMYENPMMETQRRQKALEFTIAKMQAEEQAQARQGEARYRSESLNLSRQNQETLRLLQLQQAEAAAQQKSEDRQATAEAKAAKGDAIPRLEGEAMISLTGDMTLLEDALSNWDPDYTTYWGPVGETKMQAAQSMGSVMPEFWSKMNLWWDFYRMNIENPKRHAMLGATLTGFEKADWETVRLTPGMKPDDIIKTIKKQREIIFRELKKRGTLQRYRGPNAIQQMKDIGVPDRDAKLIDIEPKRKEPRGQIMIDKPAPPAAPAAPPVDEDPVDAELRRRGVVP